MALPVFISLAYLIRCLFLSLFYLFTLSSFISSFPSFSLFIFRLLFFILILKLTAKSETHFCYMSLLISCPILGIQKEI